MGAKHNFENNSTQHVEAGVFKVNFGNGASRS